MSVLRLANYEILEKLGSGGMGEVYRARDLRLDRFVAIKVLPAEKLADPVRKQRFIQEARAASALNHPNIVTIHDIPEEDGVIFLVMEYVNGKPLDEVIAGRGLSLHAVLKYAVQIADALAAAHEARIVHRDIKPSNIMVNEQGRVKVLDFGLAKLMEPAGPAYDQPTRHAVVRTEEGMLLGSAAYMSPEQAEGKPVDARSDIFSFGSVLYEMITGQRAFQGDTWASTIAAVLKNEPKPVQELAEALPREMQRIITRCLRKELSRRSQSIAEIKLELEELVEESASGTLTVAGAPAAAVRARPSYLLPAALLIGMLTVAGVWLVSRSQPARTPTYRLRQMTRGDGLNVTPALSPDGRLLAFASDRARENNLDIWVQQVEGGGDAIRLTRHRADDYGPEFSPDGSQILFVRQNDGLYVVPALGGAERLIAKNASSGAYSPDGKWIAYSTGASGGNRDLNSLYVSPIAGGAHRKIETGLAGFYRPIWSADSRHLLGLGNETESYSIAIEMFWYVLSIDGGKPEKVSGSEILKQAGIMRSWPITWLKDDLVIFAGVQNGVRSVWQISMTPGSWKFRDVPLRVTAGAGESAGTASSDGKIPYSTASFDVSIYSLSIDSRRGKVSGELVPIVRDGARSTYPTLTRDASRMVYTSNRLGSNDIWMRDLNSGMDTPLVASPAVKRRGMISPDGSSLAFLRSENGRENVYLLPLPSGSERRLCEKCGALRNLSVLNWSPDGKSLITAEGEPQQFEALDIATESRTVLAAHPKHAIHDAILSPDGKWLAFKLVMTGAMQPVFVAPVKGGAPAPETEWTKVTGDEFHAKPFWSPDGLLLYYYSTEDTYQCLYARKLDADKKPQGEAFAVRHFHDDLRVANGSLIGYGLAVDRLFIPLESGKGNIWLAEPEKK